MIKKDLRTDLIWLLTLGAVTLLTIGLSIGFENWRTKPFEIQLHDTYFILAVEQVFLFIFLNVTFWTYLIRQGKNRFKRQSSNMVLLLVTGLLILITSLTMNFLGLMDQGWTIYPPLSASPTKIPETYSIASEINFFFLGYELFQIGVLGFIGIRIGRGIEKNNPQRGT